MRISTSGMFQQGLNAMMERQQELSRTQLQMSTMQKLTRAADDPSAWASAQRLDHAVAQLDQYTRSGDLLGHRLRLQEQALADADDVLARASELAIQGNSAALSEADRKALAIELRQLRRDLVGIANRDDGNGRHLFAGNRDGVVPFAQTDASVTYAGDDGRNRVDVAPGLALHDVAPGSDVFMRVRTGDGTISGSADAGNAGTGVLRNATVADHGAWNGASLRLEFTAADAWELRDGGGTVIATGSYTDGDTITAGGVQFALAGVPAAGDAFDVMPAPNRDIFATLDGLADALEAPLASSGDRTRAANAINAALGDLRTAQNHLLTHRAGTGTQLATLDEAADAREAESISLQETLSGLRDLDYAEAASRLSLQLTALDAAQQVMLKVQSLSLFDKLR